MIFCATILQTQSPLKSEHGVQKPCKQVFSLILYRILIDIAPNLQYNLSIKLNTVGGACVWHRLVGRRLGHLQLFHDVLPQIIVCRTAATLAVPIGEQVFVTFLHAQNHSGTA